MKDKRLTLFDLVLTLITGFFFVFILITMLALFTAASWSELCHEITSPIILSTVSLSLQTSLCVVLLTFILGFPVAYILAIKDFKGKTALDTLVDLPMVLPPLVSGLALLILFGGNSFLGGVLNSWDINIIFTKKGIIAAQFFVASPFFIKTAKESIASISKDIMDASATLGASPFYTFRHQILPLSRNGIIAGLAMTWTRALGEFGATAMVAGCIPNRTETMTIGIYMNAMSGNLEQAVSIGLILLIFSFTSLFFIKMRFVHGHRS